MTSSQEQFERAEKLIPWGTQTNSKRPDTSLGMPLFIEEAAGCRIRDVEGRWFIDYRSALGPIILGYRQPFVDEAVRRQMEKGVLFSMASPVEFEVADMLVDSVAGIDQVRFLKSGNEANLAAIRLARAYTRRDNIVTCGYHGHGDWFSCGHGAAPLWCRREGNGVPAILDELVTRLSYGSIEEAEHVFRERGDRIAAVIMVPFDWGANVAGDFVRRMRQLTEEHGALLIFDQVLTGFRLAHGGAQEYFGVIPDLSTYAKAIANGYPLAAFGGRREIMRTLYDVTITSTYAGETLSLAAAAATLGIMRSEPVIEHIWSMGERLRQGFDASARRQGLAARCIGLPPVVQFRFASEPHADVEARRIFFRELYRRGIFASHPFLLSYAHQEQDIDETIAAMDEALAAVGAGAQVDS
jgi:glutamate-1-semialdehyde 2,1-aminomutase